MTITLTTNSSNDTSAKQRSWYYCCYNDRFISKFLLQYHLQQKLNARILVQLKIMTIKSSMLFFIIWLG